jgi:hypothetical protein
VGTGAGSGDCVLASYRAAQVVWPAFDFAAGCGSTEQLQPPDTLVPRWKFWDASQRPAGMPCLDPGCNACSGSQGVEGHVGCLDGAHFVLGRGGGGEVKYVAERPCLEPSMQVD